MRKVVTVYFEPTAVAIDIPNGENMSSREIEEEINRRIYDELADDIVSQAEIDFWE